MPAPFTVAIVGRPNVGKSRLFNCLAGRRVSIVHDMPGVTRDVVSRDLEDGYTLMDTGGMGMAPGESGARSDIVAAVEGQIGLAIDAADLVLLVVDGRDGATGLDEDMAARLRRAGKPVLLVANKIDHDGQTVETGPLYRLGMGEPLSVSAEHGRGVDALRRAVLEARDAAGKGADGAAAEPEGRVIRLCFLGRPNVGKSSLGNRLVQSQRFIVSDEPGTTRDSVEIPFVWRSKRGEDWRFVLADTAGIRKKTKLASSVEYFSRTRALETLRGVDVAFMVIDAQAGPTAQDKAIAGAAVEARKPIVIVVNKWDLALGAFERGEIRGFDDEPSFRKAFEAGLRREIFFNPGSPVRFVSALENIDIEKMLYDARQLDKRQGRKLSTGQLNAVLQKAYQARPAPKVEGRRFRIYYAVQVGNRPYRIKLFCNQARRLGDSYSRYLQKALIEAFRLEGCPVVFDLVGKKNPYVKEEERRR